MDADSANRPLGRARTRLSALLVAATILVVAASGAWLIGLFPPVAVALALVVIVVSSLLLKRYRKRGDLAGPPLSSVLGHYGVVIVATVLLIQLVPYGRAHANPAVTGEPAWATPRTRELMVNACYGCHSNEVEWPWYSNVAPMSWAITAHVDEGRSAINFSEWDRSQDEAEETIETILEGEMPPSYFTRFGLHPEADLTDAEVAELVAGLRATPGMNEDEDEDEGDDENEEDEVDEVDEDDEG